MWKFLHKKKVQSNIQNNSEAPANLITGWSDFENKESLGTKGSENGVIIYDIEHSNGARITLEKDCGSIPFAITIGIYGLIFHTAFGSSKDNSDTMIKTLKTITEKVFDLHEIPENDRDEEWNIKHNELMDQIVMIDAI